MTEDGSATRLSRMGRRFQRPAIPGEETREESPAPPSRVQQEIDFKARHKTENQQIDRRLLSAYSKLLRISGHNKTNAVNVIIVKACIKAGIDVPDLNKPFSFDDVVAPPPGPSPASLREHQDVEFKLRYKTENLQIDKRLLPGYNQLLRTKGRNKTEAINTVMLEACQDAGIDVPDLDKPFSFDDVDPKYQPHF